MPKWDPLWGSEDLSQQCHLVLLGKWLCPVWTGSECEISKGLLCVIKGLLHNTNPPAAQHTGIKQGRAHHYWVNGIHASSRSHLLLVLEITAGVCKYLSGCMWSWIHQRNHLSTLFACSRLLTDGAGRCTAVSSVPEEQGTCVGACGTSFCLPHHPDAVKLIKIFF